MAQSNDRRRYGYTDGSLAYDLDALARERALDDAGRMEPQRREPVAAPRRQSVARPAVKLSPLVLACAAVLAFMQWAGYSCGGYWFACCNLLVGGSSLLPLPGLDGWHVAACLLHFLRK